MAASSLNIGTVYNCQARHEGALVQYQKALEVFLAVYCEEHPDVAKIYGNIGNILGNMGKPEEARVQLKKALEVFVAVFGYEDPLSYGRTLNFLCCSCRQ